MKNRVATASKMNCKQRLGAVYNLHLSPFRAKPVGAVLEAVCNLKNPPPLQGEARSGGGSGWGQQTSRVSDGIYSNPL